MSTNKDLISKKWAVIKEQLIALCALNILPNYNDKFAKLLSEDIQPKTLNSYYFTSLCYYILGFINAEERDKYISWPLINLQTQSKFRKGVTALVNIYQEKYPWAQLVKVPESYFMVPHKYQARVVDFISNLTNLAIHLTLNNPETLLMNVEEKLTPSEVNIMIDIVSRATQREEEMLERNIFSTEEFQEVINEVCSKCITLNQVNDELKKNISNLVDEAVSEKILPQDKKKFEIKDLLEIRDQKTSELSGIMEELSKYRIASQELLKTLNATKNPVSLSAKDFGCETQPADLTQATSKACQSLCEFFQYITSKKSSKEEEDGYYELVKKLKNCLMEEKEALTSFLS